MVDVPEKQVTDFVSKHYNNLKFKMLSGLSKRHIEDIWESIKESFVIVVHLNMLDENQIKHLVGELSQPIWKNFNSNVNNLSLRHFVFISSTPFEDMKKIRNCSDLIPLSKCVSIHFYGYNDEHYEYYAVGYNTLLNVRHK
jgi:hypothetical protein